jgi:diguanylate cyclase
MPDASTSLHSARSRLAQRLILLAFAASLLTTLAVGAIAIHAARGAGVEAEAFAALAPRLFAVGGAMAAFMSLLALRESRRIAVPIERLVLAFESVASDRLDNPLPEFEGDEPFTEIDDAFNAMLARLRDEHAQLLRSQDSLRSSNRELRLANEILSQLSITDGLTRLHNHRFFQDHLTREIKRVSRSQLPLSMLLIDIDDFKALNDRSGHAAGDEVLVRISRILESRVRDCDLLARYGGEEFVVLCSGTDLAGAYQLAEAIRIQVADSNLQQDPLLAGARISVSIGVAQYRGDRKRFFAAADRALYSAKGQGKNCVVSDAEF